LFTYIYIAGLDDLCVRFIINLPQEELESVERICFQVEEAQWFYEDFIRPLDPNLPSLSLRNFCLRIFQHCPLLSEFSSYHHSTAFSEFLAYKTRVPVRGAIMLNDAMDQVVLVKGWKKGASWSFPRGKINKDEKDMDCAVREVYEETGFDIHGAGLVGKEEEMKFIEVTMREQHMRLYVFRGVPMDTYFEPRTRKEISKIQWYKLCDLPTLKKAKTQQEGRGEDLATNANKFYMVAPFLVPLKKWIAQQHKQDTIRGLRTNQPPLPEVVDRVTTEDEPAAETHVDQPVAGDIDRLLSHLRQSSQRHTPSDLPEVSVHQRANGDASTQLKRLLNVKETSQTTNNTTVQSSAINHDTARSNSLLALLRGEATTTATGVTNNRAPPQTPLDQITTDQLMPQSPHHHHPRSLPLENIPSPPSLAFSPDNADHRHMMYPAGQPLRPIAANPPPYPSFERFSHTQHVLPTAQYPAQHARVTRSMGPNSVGPPSYRPTVAPVPQRSYDGPESLHRNGDSQSSLRHPVPTFHMVPPASKLPLPQLNSHSLALLNAFRQEKVEKSAEMEQSIPAPVAFVPATKPNPLDQLRRDSEQERHVLESPGTTPEAIEKMKESSRAMGQVPNQPSVFNTAPAGPQKNGFGTSQGLNESMNIKNGPSLHVETKNPVPDVKPRSQHQDALLTLFRKPSVPTPQVPQSSLSALSGPSEPVELSAQPSVANAVEQSRGHHPSPVRPVIDTKANVPLTQVSAEKKQRLQEAPVSATVTGPLDIPQFEIAAKKLEETPVKVKTGISSSTQPNEVYRTTPVSILRRPKSTQKVVREAAVGKERRRMVQSPQRHPEQGSKPSSESLPKPFQPQILRRPAQVPQQSPLTPSSVASVPSAASFQQATSTDRRGSDSKASKHSVPVPVNKPVKVASSGPLSSLSTELPVQAAPAHIDTARVTPVRSRIASVFPSAENGSPKPSSPLTPNDRSFLLGYLQGVAKGERR